MHFELDATQLSNGIAVAAAELLNDPAVRQQVQEAMALRLRAIVLDNLGTTGVDRPNQWSSLSRRYARRVGRSYATLYVSGQLARSIKHASYPDYAIVYQDFADCPYGEAHQYGEGRMPLRKFFPVIGDRLTSYAEAQVVDAAESQLMESLRRLSGG